jgi:hypothetical protein
MGTVSFPGVESGRGVLLSPHPLLVPRSKNTAVPLLSLRAFVAYKKGETYLLCEILRSRTVKNRIRLHPHRICLSTKEARGFSMTSSLMTVNTLTSS